jgi:hypothetical protein
MLNLFLTTMEELVGEHASAPSPVLITSRQLRARFGGISEMTVFRWERNPNLNFPKAVRINNRRYWRLADVEFWELARAAAVRFDERQPTLSDIGSEKEQPK